MLLEYDSSLSGLGLRITNLRTGQHVGSGGVEFPFDLGDQSRWQNVAEFIAIVIVCVFGTSRIQGCGH